MKKHFSLCILLSAVLLCTFTACQQQKAQVEPEPETAFYAFPDRFLTKDSLKWEVGIARYGSYTGEYYTQYDSDADYYYLHKDSVEIRVPKHPDGKLAVQEGGEEWNEIGRPIVFYPVYPFSVYLPNMYCYKDGYVKEGDETEWYRYQIAGNDILCDTLKLEDKSEEGFILQGKTGRFKLPKIQKGFATHNGALRIYTERQGEWIPADTLLFTYGYEKVEEDYSIFDAMFGTLYGNE